jgi:hypothetical protein
MDELVLPSKLDFQKKKSIRNSTQHSFQLAVLLAALVIVLSLITRITLLIQSAVAIFCPDYDYFQSPSFYIP